jgi:hypothetical protein
MDVKDMSLNELMTEVVTRVIETNGMQFVDSRNLFNLLDDCAAELDKRGLR